LYAINATFSGAYAPISILFLLRSFWIYPFGFREMDRILVNEELL